MQRGKEGIARVPSLPHHLALGLVMILRLAPGDVMQSHYTWAGFCCCCGCCGCWGYCDLNDLFLKEEGKFVENLLV